MKELFGIPVDTLLVALLVGLGLALAALAILGLRNRVLVKLALRSVDRRRGRSALIVIGLMLGTTIVAAALTTGDTMSHTIRSTAVKTLGSADETVAVKGAVDDIPGALGAATGTGLVRPVGCSRDRLGALRLRPRGRSDRRGRRAGRGPGTGAGAERAECHSLRRRSRTDGGVLAHPRQRRKGALAERRFEPARSISTARRRRSCASSPATACSSTPAPSRCRCVSATRCTSTARAPPTSRSSCRSPRRSGCSDVPARSRSSSSRTAADALAGAALSDEVSNRLGPLVGPLGLEVRDGEAGRDRGRRRRRKRIHGLLHDVRHVLDRRRRTPDLPDLRHARRRATRRARHRTRDRHAARASRRDVHVRRGRVRPCGSAGRRAARRARRARDGHGDGERLRGGGRRRGIPDRVRRLAAKPA